MKFKEISIRDVFSANGKTLVKLNDTHGIEVVNNKIPNRNQHRFTWWFSANQQVELVLKAENRWEF